MKINEFLKERLEFNKTINLCFCIFGFIILFHFLVVLGVLPNTIVWGGNITNITQLYIFEGISIVVNFLLILLLVKKRKCILSNKKHKIINVLLLIMSIIFFINTLGNLTSKTDYELYLATPMTLILSILFYRFSLENNNDL